VPIPERALRYVIWQNRATRFYAAARLCYRSQLFAPAAYAAVIALEQLLKATLVYHDRSFVLADAGHNFVKLSRMVRNKVPGGKSVALPPYFSHKQRYLTTSRYPQHGDGILVPASFLNDLDAAFVGLLCLTPFQFNTELKKILALRSSPERNAIVAGNRHAKVLRRFLAVRLRPKRQPGA
jgi:HEPN domain-containing protein